MAGTSISNLTTVTAAAAGSENTIEGRARLRNVFL